MKRLAFILIAAVILLTGCSIGGTGNSASYHQIAQEEAKEMMTKNDGHVIVDVRRQDEYDEGHIPGAVLIPNESITDKQPEQLPDLNQVILIYCRSGRRSKEASQKLADMGYTNIYEFGGINTWNARLKSSRKNLKRQSCSFKNGTAVQYLRCINKECRWALSPPLAKFRLPVKFINGGSGFALHKDSAPEKSGAPCQG